MKKFSRIFLIGFRATGKSTLGKLLADKLGWSFMDLDFLITQQEGEDVAKLTKNGTEWNRFRKVENEALKEMAVLENVVISCGGGVGVNDVKDEKTKKTFGELNRQILKKSDENLIILLTSDDKIIEERLKILFERNKIMPFINQKNTSNHGKYLNKKGLVKKQVNDSMQALSKRKPLYEKIGDLEIDTSIFLMPGKIANLNMSVGDPISHSLSPAMHNAGYKAFGIENKNLFVSCRVKEEKLERFIEAVKLLGINGISVTLPHKQKIMKCLDNIDETAEKIGAVNTVVNENGKLIGYNTDWIGAVNALKQKTGISGKKVAVLGAGGAARAIIFGILKEGGKVKIFNRTKEKAEEISVAFGCEFGGLDQISEIKNFDIVINSTSVGMDNSEESPVDKDLIRKNQIVFDVVYNPKETKLLKDAKEKGAKVIYGAEMLLYQGVEQFRLYTGLEAPVKEMEKALLGGLK